MPASLLRGSCCLLAPLALAHTLGAQTLTVERVADTTTPVPDNAGLVFESFELPHLDGGQIVFRGFSANDFHGIYRGDSASVTTIVDLTDQIPGSSRTFRGVIPGNSDNGTLAFAGTEQLQFDVTTNTIKVFRGIYTTNGATIDTIVRSRDLLAPDATGRFADVARPTISDGLVAFEGINDDTGVGIYVASPTGIVKVVDASDPIPNGNVDFNIVGGSIIENGTVVFHGVDSSREVGGIYTWDTSDELTIVADTATPHPLGGSAFEGFSQFTIDDGVVTFEAFNRMEPRGILSSDAGGITSIIAFRDTIPNSADRYIHMGSPSSINGDTLFYGIDESANGALYLAADDDVTRLIGTGDEVDGRTVFDVRTGRFAFDGTRVALRITFDDDSSGVYLGTLQGGGRSGPIAACDLNADQEVTIADLLQFIQTWMQDSGDMVALLAFLDCWVDR